MKSRHIIFLLVAILMLIPYIVDIKIGELSTSAPTHGYYNAIEELPEGSTILMSFDFDPGSRPELEPTAYATLKHLFRRNIKVIALSLWETGPMLAIEILTNASRKFSKEYGKDWAYLGYRSGRHAVVLGIGENIYTQFPVDMFQHPTKELEIMQGIQTLEDIPLVIDISAGDPGIETWIQMGTDKFETNLIGACTAVIEPTMHQYVRSGQMIGLVGAMRGAGEYEQLVGIKGKEATGTQGTKVIALGQIFVVMLIIIGNFMRKKSK